MGQGTLEETGTDRGTLGEVRDGLRDPRGGPALWSGDPLRGLGRVGGLSARSGTGRGTLGEVRDGLGDPWGGPERVGDPWEVWDGTGDPPGCP